MADTHGEGLRSAAATLTAAELTDACEAFHQHFRQRSARRVLYVTQFLWAAAIAGALVWCGARSPMTVLDSVHWAALSLFAVAIVWRLFAAAALTPTLSRLAAPERWPIYTILCPLYREAAVTPDLVAALQRLDYPPDRLDIKLLVEGDDVETLAAALAASDNASIEVVIVPAAAPRTKPKALNAGLARARGDYVVVYDAEDRPHPQQLRAALAAFEDGDPRLACVQAPLEIDNTDASWIAQQFATEYAIQFHEVLPLLARLELPLPLGGSSNHFRIEALHAEGGWDPYNVTEDADLGYRLARDGFVCGIIGPPTYEEAPLRFTAWRRQRARWIKGHIQTWLVLMRNPLLTLRDLGVGGFAAMQLTLAGGVIAAFAHGPLALALCAAAFGVISLQPPDFSLAVFGYCVAAFAALTACALTRNLAHARAALTMPFYWPLATLAALSALFDLVVRPHHWAKTTHGVAQRRAPILMGAALARVRTANAPAETQRAFG